MGAESLYRLRQPLWQAALIVCGLLLCSLYLAFAWVLALPPLLQVLLGMALGLTCMASYSNTQMQRSHYRRRISVILAQLSLADMFALRKLLANNEKALSWLPGPSDAELARWINAGLEKIWPFLKEATSGIIKVKLERAFNNYKAGAIKEISLKKLNLGNCCPFIEGVKFVPGNKDNQCCLEIELDWRQNDLQDMILSVSTIGPNYVVEVKNFVLYCVLRLTFTPLVWELPGFAAVVVSIVEPPLVDFQTKLVSDDAKKISGMEKAIDNILLSSLMDMLVWPGRVVVPVLPGDYRELEARCIGHLHVQLVEARDLTNREITGRSDPYVVLFLRRRNDLIKQSTQMHNTTCPVWNEQFSFNVEDLHVQKLTVKLMNADEAGLDVFVGIAELAISQLEANVGEDFWVDLVGDPEKLHGRFAGKIHLLVELKPNDLISDINNNASGAEGPIVSSALLASEQDGSLRTHGDGNQFVMENLRGNNSLNRGLGVILEGNGKDTKYDRFSSVSLHSPCSSPADFAKAEIQDLPRSIPDVKVERQEPSGNIQKLCCYDEIAQPVEGRHLLPPDGNDISEAQQVDSFESESSSNVPFCREKLGSEIAVSKNHKGTDYALPRGNDLPASNEKICESCIAGNNERHNNDIYMGTVHQPSLGKSREIEHQPDHVVVGDPGWGLNGLSLEHCNTSAVHEDIFSSEIFEVD